VNDVWIEMAWLAQAVEPASVGDFALRSRLLWHHNSICFSNEKTILENCWNQL
jgi:hypothetical protein